MCDGLLYLSTAQSLTMAPFITVVTLLMTFSNCWTILLIVSVGVASDSWREINKNQQNDTSIENFTI